MAYSKQNFQNGQTLDAANLETMENGIIAGQGVKNLLINSNFKDPINSSGKTSWSASGITIDKWRTDSAATVNLTSSGITVDATDIAGNFQQNIDNLPNGTYTFAALVNNIIRTIAFTNNNGTITTVDNSNASFGGSGSINVGKESSAYYVQINNVQGHTNTIAWTALYEGNYTVDTLPNYIPKDKHIEMSNCGIPAQPRNLLDNSDFSNPVNHRGATSYTGSGYTIDRWCTLDDEFSITIDESSISFSGGSLVQYLQKDISGIHTIAAMTNSGTLHVYTADIGEEVSYSGNLGMGRDSNGTNVVSLAPGTYVWAALYEGAYTVGTLPPYIPKDRRVEMINCGISLQPQNLLDNSDFSNPVNSRGKNTYSDEGNEYTIDKWKTGYKTNISIENGYINIFGHWRLEQYIQNPKDGIYTFAARIRINSIGRNKPVIYVDDNSGPSNDLFLDANIGEWKTYILQHDFSSTTGETITFAFSLRGGDTTASISVEWAAMYKGAYTADTLPPYVPKGKHVEMLNCGISLTPKNLLVNSDFRNPIDIDNKIGATNVNPCFTRWNFERANPSTTTQIIKTDNGIRVYKKGGEARFYQSCNYNLLGKTVSYAVGTTEGIFVGSCSVSTSSVYTQIGTHTGHLSVYQGSASEKAIFSLFFNDNTEDAIDLYWAALYEGAYTADTLPSYIPKDKHVEMLNCGIPTSPRNILKNSDFTNPLNTKGFSSISSGAYTTIDCWNSWISGNGGKIELTSSGIKLSPPSSENIGIYQQIENYQLNKIYTVVVYINDLPYLKSFQMGNWQTGTNFGPVCFYSIPSANVLIRINSTDSEVIIQKVALYEGAYTLDTIPMYQSESKHVEMLNCNVPLAPYNLLDNSDFSSPIAQAGLNGMHGSMKYVCDRWISWDADATFGSGYITPGSPIDQRLSKTVVDINKTYTAAICLSDGTIKAESGTFSNGFGSYPLGIYCMQQTDSNVYVTVRLNGGNNIRWAALYEGAYTVDTLPSYIPKDKHVEMLNCGVPLQPRNLLKNNNFLHPSNVKRGATSYSGKDYDIIDLWNCATPDGSTTTTELTNDGLKFTHSDGSSQIYLRQDVSDFWDSNKEYTLGFYKSDGTFYYNGYYNSGDGRINFTIPSGFIVEGVVCYEGHYTESTLPPFDVEDMRLTQIKCNVNQTPKNYLINADFTNPSNSHGKSVYSGTVENLDGWVNRVAKQNTEYYASNTYLRFYPTEDGSGYSGIYQRIRDFKELKGQPVTFVARVGSPGTSEIGFMNSSGTIVASKSCKTGYISTVVMNYIIPSDATESNYMPVIYSTTTTKNNYVYVYYAAIYKGNYNEHNLPVYQTPSIMVTRLNCGVPFAPHNLLDNSDFTNPVNQRGITSQIGGGYGLDRWRADGNGTISVESTGISLTNLSFRQPVPLKAGTYTLAFHLSDGKTLGYVFKFDGSSTLNAINSSWNETTGAYINYYKHSTGVVMVQIVVAEGYTIIVDWAALYEGSYDASTLPAYQPKGYAAELAECQMYYKKIRINVAHSYNNIFTASFPINMRITPTVNLIKFDAYGKAIVSDMTGCALECNANEILYAVLPTCLDYQVGGLSIELSAEL